MMQHPPRRPAALVGAACTIVLLLQGLTLAQAKEVTEDILRNVLRIAVDAQLSAGIVAGVVDGEATRIAGVGRVAPERGAPDGRTIYEIGSITKVFTALLLADAVERGELGLDDLLREHLPKGTAVPRHQDGEIRLAHLARHASGLPRLPPNFDPAEASNPYADYTAEKLYEALGMIELRGQPGARADYSNLGAGLLGHVLALRAGKSYEALVRERIAGPLGLVDTLVTLDEARRSRCAPPFDQEGKRQSAWDFEALAGAGALRSTVEDLLRFARAHFDRPEGALGRALARIQGSDGSEPLGWLRGEDGVLWHNGGTGGYRAWIGIHPGERRAAVVLANTTASLVDELGAGVLGLVRGRALKPVTVRIPIELGDEELRRYPGTYRFPGGPKLVITRDRGGLRARLGDQEALRIMPASRQLWYYQAVDAELEFELDEAGCVVAVTLIQEGRRQRAARIE